jgi:L-ascorbate metabolism protein UlaG (beta-lactamase superfamily)
MKTRIYHTVNCGLYLLRDEVGIFLDGLHGGREFGYSDSFEETVEDCRTKTGVFKNLQALLFTHKHIDHFDSKLIEVVDEKKQLLLYAPDWEENNVNEQKLGRDLAFFKIGSFKIYAITTIHDGKPELRAEPHVSFLINTEEESFFFAGDATFLVSEAERINGLCEHLLSAAFINPYQVLLGENKKFLRKLDPEKVILIHKPLQKDDSYDIYRIFETAKKAYPKDMPQLSEAGFSSWLEF